MRKTQLILPILQIAHVHGKIPRIPGRRPKEAQAYRFVFATHARAYRSTMSLLLRWQGQQRGCLIDEGLHKADPFGVDLRDLNGAVGG